MEEDFQNYLPTFMFHGTPCTFTQRIYNLHLHLLNINIYFYNLK